MAESLPDQHQGEHGLAAVEWSVAVALTMVVLLFVGNVAVMQYTAGAVRAAAAAGARSGSRFPAGTDDCVAAAEAVLRGEFGLLRGPIGSEARIRCVAESDHMVVTIEVAVPWFVGEARPVSVVETRRQQLETPP